LEWKAQNICEIENRRIKISNWKGSSNYHLFVQPLSGITELRNLVSTKHKKRMEIPQTCFLLFNVNVNASAFDFSGICDSF